jgi:hypothetical protein
LLEKIEPHAKLEGFAFFDASVDPATAPDRLMEGALISARSLFHNLPPNQQTAKLDAIANGFDAVVITQRACYSRASADHAAAYPAARKKVRHSVGALPERVALLSPSGGAVLNWSRKNGQTIPQFKPGEPIGTNPLLDEVYAKSLKVEHCADVWSGAARPANLKTDQKLR